jgi:hypothetical protein
MLFACRSFSPLPPPALWSRAGPGPGTYSESVSGHHRPGPWQPGRAQAPSWPGTIMITDHDGPNPPEFESPPPGH